MAAPSDGRDAHAQQSIDDGGVGAGLVEVVDEDAKAIASGSRPKLLKGAGQLDGIRKVAARR